MKLKSTYLISTQAILFALFLLIAFFFNRFAVDDYHFIGELRTSSFSKIYSHLYYDWHGRWTSNFLLVYLLKFHQLPLFLTLYNIFSVSVLCFGIFRLLKSVNSYYNLNFSKKILLTYTIISISVFFFCTISANDTWLWYTSTVVYLWSTIAFFWGVNLFFNKKKNFFNYLIFGVSAIYIGGSNEPLTFLIILSLLFMLAKKREFTLSTVGIIAICASFLINYLSPGTQHRDVITPDLNFVDLALYTGYSIIKYLFFTIYKTFIPALFLGLPFYLLGKKINTALIENFKPIKALVSSLVLIIGVVGLNQLIVVYALGGLSPDRSGIASSIVIAIILVRYLFLLGNYHQEKYNAIKYLLVLNVVVLIGFNGYYANVHYTYSKAVDERIEFIKQHDNGIIRVSSLPKSGYIYSAEITSDANNFKNQHLKNGLGVKNDIVLITDR